MSALSDLFQEIADAIRTKTGGTDTMAPVTFPDNILSIVTGGNSGDSGELQFKVESVTPTSSIATVTHGMEIVPDIICVIAGHVPADKKIIGACGMTTAMVERFGVTVNKCNFIVATTNGATMQFVNTNGMELDASSPAFGTIRNVTDSTFTFGGSTIGAYSSNLYYWFAIAGLT